MKLSILICSLPKRKGFLSSLLTSFRDQHEFTANSMVKTDKYDIVKIASNEVEIVICTDDKKMRVGAKRNLLIDESIGEYFVFVDDDDRVSDDYIKYLLAGIKDGNDVILFDVACSINGAKPKKVIYDASYIRDQNKQNSYLRIPNHIMCWKRGINGGIDKFPNINMGEDAQWAKKMKHKIKSQSRISKTLYYYDFNNQTTETQ